jgi:hypothetical protein
VIQLLPSKYKYYSTTRKSKTMPPTETKWKLSKKLNKDIKKQCRPISLMNINAKILKKYCKPNSIILLKKIICHNQIGCIPEIPQWFYICTLINIRQCMNRIKENNCTITSIDASKAFDKIQYFSMIIALRKVRIRRFISQYSYMWQTYRKHYTEWGKLKVFPLNIINNTRFPTFTILLCMMFAFLARSRKQER